MKTLFSLIAAALLFVSCTKVTNDSPSFVKDEKMKALEAYKLLTMKSIPPKIKNHFQNNFDESSFPTIEEQDLFNTTVHEMIENGDTSIVYLTPIYRNNVFVAGIIGYLLQNGTILNTVHLYDRNEELESDKVHVFYIDGTQIGSYGVVEDVVVDAEVVGSNDGIDPSASTQARSWWACTRECISDATIACMGSNQCMTLLFISNLGGGGVYAGQGGASIGIACGISCVRNSNLDLLPGV